MFTWFYKINTFKGSMGDNTEGPDFIDLLLSFCIYVLVEEEREKIINSWIIIKFSLCLL